MKRSLFVLGTAALVLASRAARADELQDHVARASTFTQGERHREALAELELAYAIRQSPLLLHAIAKAKQRLGDGQAALSAYERFLVAAPEADEATRRDAFEQVALLRRLLGRSETPAPPSVAPAPAEWPREVPYEMKPSSGLMAGGAVLFGAAYLSAVVSASIYLSGGPPSCGTTLSNGTYYFSAPCPGNPQVAAGTLLIPFAGPFIAALTYRDPAWSINWSLVDGIAQVAGLTMMVYAAKHPRKVPVYGRSFHVLPYGSTGSGGLRAVGRF